MVVRQVLGGWSIGAAVVGAGGPEQCQQQLQGRAAGGLLLDGWRGQGWVKAAGGPEQDAGGNLLMRQTASWSAGYRPGWLQARPTLCRAAGVSGRAGLQSGGTGSGSSCTTSRCSCTASTNAATSGLRWAGGTAVARARRRSRNSAPGGGAAIAWDCESSTNVAGLFGSGDSARLKD